MAAAKSKSHHIIFVPGLGDTVWYNRWITRNWNQDAYVFHFHKVFWYDNESFNQKLDNLLKKIDSIYKKYGKVSLIGVSAGASLVLHAFYNNRKKVHKVVNICGRVRKGYKVFPPLWLAALRSKSFKESVETLEPKLKNIKIADKKRILTIRALFDEIVPEATTTIKGAQNIRIASIGHNASMIASLTIYKNVIQDFLSVRK